MSIQEKTDLDPTLCWRNIYQSRFVFCEMNMLDYIDDVDPDRVSHPGQDFQTRFTLLLLKFKRLNHAEYHRIINILKFLYKLCTKNNV